MLKSPRNLCVLLLLLVGTAGVSPAHAQTERTTCSGTIVLPSLPSFAVDAHESGLIEDGVVGFVCRLLGRDDGASYTLMRTTPGPANLDAYFFEDDDGRIGEGCHTIASDDRGPLIEDPAPLGELLTYLDARTEEGTICPGEQDARWAVIVLRTGIVQGFEFEVRPSPRST